NDFTTNIGSFYISQDDWCSPLDIAEIIEAVLEQQEEEIKELCTKWMARQTETTFKLMNRNLRTPLPSIKTEKTSPTLLASQKVKNNKLSADHLITISDIRVSYTRRVPVKSELVACKSKVIHLPRHMRNVHKWSKEASSKVLVKYNIRKRKSPEKKKGGKHKDYHTRRRCPVNECHSIVFRLTAHLQKVHKMESSSKEYRDAMERARVIPDKKHPMICWKYEQMHKTSVLLKDWQKPNTSADYFEDERYSDDVDEMTDGKFAEWMLSADGGRRDEKTAKQHSSQLFGMLKAIDETEDINSLLDLELVRNVFLKCYVVDKNYEVGTIKSYLMSLRHFFSFLLSSKPAEMDCSADDVKAAREKVQMWSTSYRRESSIRKWKKLEEDFQNRLTTMNIKKFEKNEAVREVMDHKTAHVYGPAIIVLSQKLMSWLSIFVEVMRAQITTSNTGHVFLTWNGQSMISGQITRAIQSVFKKAKINQKITSTSFRKAAVTKVHTEEPELSGKLAGLMAHRETTAKKYYLLSDKSKASVEASRKLGKLMRTNDSMAGKSTEDETEGLERNKEEGKKKVLWRDSDLSKVYKVFEEEIKMKSITFDTVRRRVEGNEQLNGMSPRRIYDRLKKDMQKAPHDVLDVGCELPKACESLQDKFACVASPSLNYDDGSSASIVPPSERNSNFSNAQIETIQSIFKDMISNGKTISRVEIEKRCGESRDAQQLLNKLSILQLLNCIKYERRKKVMLLGKMTNLKQRTDLS
ncbi:Neurofilament medium polypeptide, partial [Paramuricea clavata]